eukprot:m.847507 g.847507  ORF g.847507 m.847507 type:complete len:769 (+) comp23485_c0_seq1:89-2395(+)
MKSGIAAMSIFSGCCTRDKKRTFKHVFAGAVLFYIVSSLMRSEKSGGHEKKTGDYIDSRVAQHPLKHASLEDKSKHLGLRDIDVLQNSASHIQRRQILLENKHISLAIDVLDVDKRKVVVFDRIQNLAAGLALPQQLKPELFLLETSTKWIINSSQCTATDVIENHDSSVSTVNVHLVCPHDLLFMWTATLDDNDHFLRIRVRWQAAVPTVPLYVLVLRMSSAGVRMQGSVLGSPFSTDRSLLFVAAEHPLAVNGLLQTDMATAVCGTGYLPTTPVGAWAEGLSVVVGSVVELSQLRRDFQRYLATTRASPPRPFLHYNSWFDFASWQEPNASFHDRNMTEDICLDRVTAFGTALVRDRNVVMDSFLWDDGWDNQSSMWDFNRKTFPHGFDNIRAAASTYDIGTGVWLSPWGGYGDAKESRLEHAAANGYETSEMTSGRGFSLSGPRYFKRFHDIMLNMVVRYNVNMFKVDGIGFEGNHTTIANEMEGMLHLVQQLRASAQKDLFVSLTTGTWPSPFWLQHGDAVWRGHRDLGLDGTGSRRLMWINFRDAVVYHLVVRRAALFPLSGLMLHGIVLGAVGESRAAGLDTMEHMADFEQEVWSYFAMGVCLQELYISPDLMTPALWDVVAAAAKWARSRHSILQDSHWIGNDPLSSIYGFASWSAINETGIVLLRNPHPMVVSVNTHLRAIFEMPTTVPNGQHYNFTVVYGGSLKSSIFTKPSHHREAPRAVCPHSTCTLSIDLEYLLSLPPMSVLLVEGRLLGSSVTTP